MKTNDSIKRKQITEQLSSHDVSTLLSTIESLVARVDQLMVENKRLMTENKQLKEKVKKLEARLGMDSSNSSKPPSTDNPYKPKPKSLRKPSGLKPGAQQNHKGTTLHRIEEADEIVNCFPVCVCKQCGKTFRHQDCNKVATRQVVDIKISRVVTSYQAFDHVCTCGHHQQGDFPIGVNASMQYGDNVKSLVTYLRNAQLIPYNRICELLKDCADIKISPATIISFTSQCAQMLTDWENETKAELVKQPVLHADETGVSVNKKLFWTHVISNENTTLLYASPKRGIEGICARGIDIENFNGILVHDFWKAYERLKCKHAYCLAHILRELTFAHEQDKQSWAKQMISFLTSSLNTVKKFKNDGQTRLPQAEIDTLITMYDIILNEANKESPLIPSAKTKRIKRTKAQCLIRRLINYKDDLLRFLRDFRVPFTNNQAEQDLRMCKVQQKISGCFRKEKDLNSFLRLRSYIATLRKRSISVYDAICKLFNSSDIALSR